jgi:hypothetical protein
LSGLVRRLRRRVSRSWQNRLEEGRSCGAAAWSGSSRPVPGALIRSCPSWCTRPAASFMKIADRLLVYIESNEVHMPLRSLRGCSLNQLALSSAFCNTFVLTPRLSIQTLRTSARRVSRRTRDLDVPTLLDDVFKGHGRSAVAFEEAEGVSMTIHADAVCQPILLRDSRRAAPRLDFGFDLRALRVSANRTRLAMSAKAYFLSPVRCVIRAIASQGTAPIGETKCHNPISECRVHQRSA